LEFKIPKSNINVVDFEKDGGFDLVEKYTTLRQNVANDFIEVKVQYKKENLGKKNL